MNRMEKISQKISLKLFIIYLVFFGLIILINYPFFWMMSTSIKDRQEVYIIPSRLIPKVFHWENYILAWNMAPWINYIRNSFITAIFPVIGQVVLGSMAAFAFTRKFTGSKIIFTIFLGTMMIPAQATLIPNYVILKSLGWLNTYLALVVPFLTGAFAIFLIRQYFLSIPKDYEDAAVIDGCGSFYFLFRILMPLAKPALLTVALLAFNDRWNDYLYSMIMITKDYMRTVQVGMAVFQGDGYADWNYLMAASTFITIPVIILFLFVQKWFIDGVMTGGVKG